MRVVVITPPDPIVSLDQAKQHLRVLSDDEDALITATIEAATANIDGPDGWLGRSIGVQTLEARFSQGETGPVRLPFGPVIELLSVKYLDGTGSEQAGSISDFDLFGSDLAPSSAWPWGGESRNQEAVRVRYRAGYETIPAPIRAAILLMVGDLWAFRQTVEVGSVAQVPMSAGVESLLTSYRLFA